MQSIEFWLIYKFFRFWVLGFGVFSGFLFWFIFWVFMFLGSSVCRFSGFLGFSFWVFEVLRLKPYVRLTYVSILVAIRWVLADLQVFQVLSFMFLGFSGFGFGFFGVFMFLGSSHCSHMLHWLILQVWLQSVEFWLIYKFFQVLSFRFWGFSGFGFLVFWVLCS